MSWRKLVEEFSGRKLTYGKDRLPALAGLTQGIMVKITDGVNEDEESEYLAGHWKRSLEIDLAWVPELDNDDMGTLEDDIPKAPSRSMTWSWCTYPRKVS